MNKVIIAGGTGLVGENLTKMFVEDGYEVVILSRKGPKQISNHVSQLSWDPDRGIFPLEALAGTDVVINLAGANIAAHRWTTSYRKEILDSRLNSTRTIVDALNKYSGGNEICFINASAIGYYGYNGHPSVKHREEDAPGTDFMAKVTVAWEAELTRLNNEKIRPVILRIGIVLSSKQGALAKLALPVKFFVGALFGSGKQLISWIHIDDLCAIFRYAIQKKYFTGVYNASAPNPSSNLELTKAIGQALHRPVFLPGVPAWVLKIMVGDLTESLVGSINASCEKLANNGFTFVYSNVNQAVEDIFYNCK